jgi:hypothetical protein
MAPGWNLQAIQAKVRNITGAPSEDQLSTVALNDYINNYYVYSMPFELKEQIQLQFLDFYTFPGQDVYSFPGSFLTDQPMAYCDGYPLIFYQDPDVFYQDWPQEYATDSLANGDGIASSFTGGLQNPPIIIGSLFITDGVQVAQDNGLGGFSGDVASPGSINYQTGAFTVNFAVPCASGAVIYGKYQGYEPARPQSMLFFNNQFTFRAVPGQVHAIRMQGYVSVAPLVNLSDTPTLPEWGQLIAYGAALDIFSDRGDLDSYAENVPLLKRFENIALARTVQQFQANQTIPRW